MIHHEVPPLGTVFLVPLKDSGCGIGVLARASGDGHAFGYFFGPRVFDSVEIIFDELRPENALLVGKFGDLELVRGNWPIVGGLENWNPIKWPMPPMVRVDVVDGRAWLSRYDDDFNLISEIEVDPESANGYVYDRSMGAGAVEIRLTKLINAAQDGK